MEIGASITNRHRQKIKYLIKFFVNTLALRFELSNNPTFQALLKQVRQFTLEAYAHQDLSFEQLFEQLMEGLQPQRDMSRNPLVQVALVFLNTPMPPLTLTGEVSRLAFDSVAVRFDLEFHLWEESVSNIKPDSFDTVILNSVIQYFPNVTYLLKVLEPALVAVKPGGHIFVGDVRNLRLLKAYHASVQLYQAPDSLTRLELQQRVQPAQEEDLLIEPSFFKALKQHYPKLANVQIKAGTVSQ